MGVLKAGLEIKKTPLTKKNVVLNLFEQVLRNR